MRGREGEIMKKIILDCDPGMDDSMAIVMAVKSPELLLNTYYLYAFYNLD